MKTWLNGEIVGKSKAVLPVDDHGTLYGDGVFEGIRAYNGKIFQCQAHVDRLFESARYIRLPIEYTKQELVDAMYQTLEENGAKDSYIRMVVTRGPGKLGINPFLCPMPNTFIVVDTIELYPEEMYRDGMAVIIAKTSRTSANMLSPAAKTLNYLNNITAKIEAIEAGVAEAIMLNQDGNVAECTGDNIFMIKDSVVITPPKSAGILMGITRGAILGLADKLDIEKSERDFTPPELYQADECFLTGTAAEVIGVTKVNDRNIGDGTVGPITKKLTAAFHELVREQ